jgi:hypothetical protein
VKNFRAGPWSVYALVNQRVFAQNAVAREMSRALPLAYPPIRKSSKSMARICSRQERELIALRGKVAALQAALAALRTATVPIPTGKAAERAAAKEKLFAEIDAAKVKLFAEIDAAKVRHAEFLAREAVYKPDLDRKQAEWEAEQKQERRARHNACARKYYAAHREQRTEYDRQWRADNPGKNAAASRRWRAKQKQINASVDLPEAAQ